MITTEQMVQREILCCMSSLVSTLAQGYGALLTPPTSRAVRNLAEQASELAAPVLDYEEAARQDGWRRMGVESDRFIIFKKGTPITDTIHAATWGELCELQNLDPYEWEVYEHWAVSQWLADKLIAQGERVDTDFAGLNIWARTATGQAIAMDGCIQRVYADMMVLA